MTYKLPNDFWEEFDRRLDARLDAKLDEKFDSKLKPIYERLTNIENWTKRQDNTIEYELHHAVNNYLISTNIGYITVEPTVFPKELEDKNGKTLTEFDGLLILTNDIEHANSLSKKLPKPKRPPLENTIAYIIIVEAKQHVTSKKIKNKIKQVETIKQLINDIQNGIIEIPAVLVKLGIQYIKGVRLFIGGLDIDDAGRDMMIMYCKNDPMSGLIELNGSRFSISNITNDFGNQQFGGNK